MANPYSGYYQQYPLQEQYLGASPAAPMALPANGGGNGAIQQPSGLGGAIGGPIQAGFGIVQSIKNNKLRKLREQELEKAVLGMPEYTESPIIRNMYAQAQAQQNATNPAIAAMYRQAQQGAANTAAIGQRNAMSGAEAINAAIAGQTQAQSAFPQIAQMQTQYNMANQANLQHSQRLLNNERQNVFNSQVAKNDALQNLRGGQFKNATKLWQDAWGNIIGGANATGNAAGEALKIFGGGM